jgi:hypothetical protein
MLIKDSKLLNSCRCFQGDLLFPCLFRKVFLQESRELRINIILYFSQRMPALLEGPADPNGPLRSEQGRMIVY